jgi:hypothetical protein
MKHNRIIRKKPKIFSMKVELAELIRKNWEKIKYTEYRPHYWGGTFKKGDITVSVYLQNYTNPRRRMMRAVATIDIYRNNKALTVREIKSLYEKEKEKCQ